MEAADVSHDTVHPEVRAHINSLVSALGGQGADDDGRYKLGDDALEVLRDLKRWIRFYDEKTNRMDVARCLADANLVGGDLLHILASWPESEAENRLRARIALACFEVMVPLTWPIERDVEKMTVNHHRHLPVLQLAQVGYKRAIINFDGAQILHTAVRVALPSMAMPIGDRSPRDQGIIKLMLFFLRNMAMIAPPPGVTFDSDESQISRPALIDAFSYQDIFLTLLTMASNMGDDFRTEDLVVMETIFHLVKRVDVRKLFLREKELLKAKADELRDLVDKEATMLRSYSRKAPTRHSRFGTMIWVKRENGKVSTLSGQDALRDAASRESKIDSTKTFKPPRRARKEEMEPQDMGPPVSLNTRANDQLRGFVEEFLDSGFNPLFQHVRKTIDREAPHLMHYHRAQFFYLVAWFLEAERARKKMKQDEGAPLTQPDDVRSFNLVAGVLNQEMFIALSRALDRAYNDKDWRELTTIMRCFTQILLTVQEMSESGNEDDEEIADNILNRLFYEEATHEAVTNIIKNYKDQGFEYLDACTELTHTYLRILESYSKQNVDMQVRSRKTRRRKKKAAKKAAATAAGAGGGEGDEDNPIPGGGDEEEDDSADDPQAAERTTRERKFDFSQFARRFVPQGVVDAFVRFTQYYRDLDDAQLKRAHRYFYRVAFKQDMSVMLFRVDILHLLVGMVRGDGALDRGSPAFKEWEELSRQVIKRCLRKLDERPALFTELLFSKIGSTAHYLEYGYEKQTLSTHPRPGAELEFKNKTLERGQQIAIAVGVLLDRNQNDHLDWLKKQLASVESERRAWESAEAAARAEANPFEDDEAGQSRTNPAEATTIVRDDDTRRMAMFKNPHLRLLMKLVGIERLAPSVEETPESVWIIPGDISADELKECLDQIEQAEFSPPVFEEGELAENQLRRKSAARKRANFDDDGDDVDDFLAGDNEALFPMDPRERAAPGKGRRRRRPSNDEGNDDGIDGEDEPTEAERKARARARRLRELERARKIKSELFVHESDDDEWSAERDEAFFAREEAIRQRVGKAMLLGQEPTAADLSGLAKSSRAARAGNSDEDESASDAGSGSASSPGSSRKRRLGALQDEESGEDEQDGGLLPTASSRSKRRQGRFGVRASGRDEDAANRSLQPSTQSSSADDGDENARGRGSNDEDEMQTEDTPLSSSPRTLQADAGAAKGAMKPLNGKTQVAVAGIDDEDDEDDDLPVASKKRTRVRAGFVLDDSDEE